MKDITTGLFIIIVVLLLLGYCSNTDSGVPQDPNAWKTRDNSGPAYNMMEYIAKDRILKSPSTAEFPGIFDGKLDHVRALGNQTYRIVSYVDAQNGFGAQIRTRFVCEIKQTGPGMLNDWQILSFKVLE